MEAAGFTVVKRLPSQGNAYLVTRAASSAGVESNEKTFEKQFIIQKFDAKGLALTQLNEVMMEAMRLQQAAYPNVLAVVDCFVDKPADSVTDEAHPGPAVCLVTERAHGVNLEQEISRRAAAVDSDSNGVVKQYMSELQVMFIFTQVLLAKRHFAMKGFKEPSDCSSRSILLTRSYVVKACVSPFVQFKIDSFRRMNKGKNASSKLEKASAVTALGMFLYELCFLEKYDAEKTASEKLYLESAQLAELVETLIKKGDTLSIDDVFTLPHVVTCMDQLVECLPVSKYPELQHLHNAHTELRAKKTPALDQSLGPVNLSSSEAILCPKPDNVDLSAVSAITEGAAVVSHTSNLRRRQSAVTAAENDIDSFVDLSLLQALKAREGEATSM
eukprot:Selendium_serpulae@DN5595_c0_g1_i1.p1